MTMNTMTKWGGVVAGVCWGAMTMAQEELPFHVENFLRLGWDDNVTYAENDKLDTFFIREELSISFDQSYETGFLGLRYQPALDWYDDVGGDSQTEWTHAADINWTQMFGRNVSLTLSDAFAKYDRSEIVDSDGVLRQPNFGYTYNTAAGTLVVLVSPTLRLNGSVRYQILRYDDELIADREDYDIWSYGLSLGIQAGKSTMLFVDGSIEDITYDGSGKTQLVSVPGFADQVIDTIPNRDAITYNVGLGLEQVFSPNLLGRLRAGYTLKEMDAANQSDEDSPYGEAQITILPAPTTRLTLAAAYSLYQSGLLTFANQSRTTFSASLAHDVTARITVSLNGRYYISDYDASTSVNLLDEGRVEDGTETASSFGARVSYCLDRRHSHWIEAGYTYSNFDSDYRYQSSIQRNRVDIGWKFRL